ncbi:MAG: polymer-forming cytoskeletal protein [Candidatus Margulisiibacteriota bacterium]
MGFFEKPGRERVPGIIETIIGKSASLKGEIETKGSIRVDGTLDGSIAAEQEAMIGESAKVKGNVKGLRVIVAGEVNGNVSAKESVEIKKMGRVFGDISGNTLTVDEGASYKGKVTMGIAKEMEDDPKDVFSDKVKEIIGL